VALGTGAAADVCIDLKKGAPRITSRREVRQRGRWTEIECEKGRLGVLPLQLDDLRNGLRLDAERPPEHVFEHHLVVYAGSASEEGLPRMLAFAKLQAIEHRVGVAVLAGGDRELVKTNRYKNIQRFEERDGRFGMNAEFLGGPWSTASANSRLGIPREFFSAYLALSPIPWLT